MEYHVNLNTNTTGKYLRKNIVIQETKSGSHTVSKHIDISTIYFVFAFMLKSKWSSCHP